jgi:hypothetical protein
LILTVLNFLILLLKCLLLINCKDIIGFHET